MRKAREVIGYARDALLISTIVAVGSVLVSASAIHHTCQSRTALPQCQRSTVVQRRGRRRGRTTLVEVLSGHIGDLGRGREINDCLSAFGGGNCEKLGEPSQVRDQPAAFIGEACCNETRMQTIRGDTCALETPSEFARKQDVAKL